MRRLRVDLLVGSLCGLALAILGIMGIQNGYSVWHTEHNGIPGSVTIGTCEPHWTDEAYTWTCHGVFEATQSETRIERVRLRPDITSDARPTGSYPAIVLHAEADVAVEPGHWLRLLLFGLVILGAGGWLFLALGRRLTDRKRVSRS